ncbi:DUF6445 family protein [Undibacterium danionis]|uniref:DUF6445 family protein n=1 Tax=Undibacterium danionis TaxID=1812100 RepID=A0ABV6IFB2_9BURK
MKSSQAHPILGSDWFNPNASLSVVPLFDQHRCVVIDDFLGDPTAMQTHAAKNLAYFRYDKDNYYPGVEIDMGRAFALALEQYFVQKLRVHFQVRRNLGTACRMAITTLAPEQLQPLQRLCHRDSEVLSDGMGIFAGVVNLFHQPELGGTSFYRPTRSLDETRHFLNKTQQNSNDSLSAEIGERPSYLTHSNPYFELMRSIPAKWNRAIFYEGTVFHAAHITHPKLLSQDPQIGRLCLNAFFKVKKSAMA